MDQPLVIWCNVPFGAAMASRRQRLVDSVSTTHTLHVVDETTPPELSRSWLERAAIAFGQPPIDGLLASNQIRWVELGSAGYEKYDRPDLRAALTARGAPLTNAGGVYADACAQHVLAMILAGARGLPAAWDAQRERRWSFTEMRPRMRELARQRVLILGWGQIAQRLAALLAPFDLQVTAVRRRVSGDELVRTITADGLVRTITADGLDEELARVDHLVNLLPGGAGTDGFVSAARISRLPAGASFYNVGRGTTVDQRALIAALESGHLGAAWLDVTEPEPLPPDHPLWRTPRCYITPHLAGGQSDERGHQVRHFLDNLARFTSGQTLNDRIW
jgi:phosphoglycerate dehydrogenase-like enzyme